MWKREDREGRIDVLINVQYVDRLFRLWSFFVDIHYGPKKANRKQYPVDSKIIDPKRNINVPQCDIVLKSPRYTTNRVARLVDI